MKVLLPLFLLLSACVAAPATPPERVSFRIAFGSCAHQDQPQPMLDVAADLNPDVFIYLGDNIYGDSYEIDTLRAKYTRLAARPEFQKLRASTDLLATWDDHDYGYNDIGRHYPLKEESKGLFLEFWEVPADSERRDHPGIYGTEYLERDGKRIQIILLDTRTFRDDLLQRKKTDTAYKNDYVPNPSPDSTFLGAAQWAWLETELRKPADLRIVASSNQFSHSYNGWESWTNVPRERERMTRLIQKTQANGVIFVSGDVHWGEISRLETDLTYPLYDVTSSGINRTWDKIEPNTNRVGKAIAQNNIGMIEVQWSGEAGTAVLSLIDSTRLPVSQTQVDLTDLRFE